MVSLLQQASNMIIDWQVRMFLEMYFLPYRMLGSNTGKDS